MGLLKLNKGQVISTEFLFAIFILIILLVLGVSLWNLTATRLSEDLIKTELATSAIEVSDYLLKSQGAPTDWEENITNLASLGLGATLKGNKLDRDKVSALLNLDYDKIKESLGIKSYEFYFKITDLSSNLIQISGNNTEVGLKPNASSHSVNSQRIAILGNEFVYMNVITWK